MIDSLHIESEIAYSLIEEWYWSITSPKKTASGVGSFFSHCVSGHWWHLFFHKKYICKRCSELKPENVIFGYIH